jgi:hypothetical protein
MGHGDSGEPAHKGPAREARRGGTGFGKRASDAPRTPRGLRTRRWRRYEHPRQGPLPPTASVAVQQGPYAARDIERKLRGVPDERRKPFEFFNRGYVVSLGPESGVADPLGVKIRAAPPRRSTEAFSSTT